MNSKILLPYCIPPVVSYTSIAYAMSIYLAYPEVENWFATQYINLWSPIHEKGMRPDSYGGVTPLNMLGGDAHGGALPLRYEKHRKTERIASRETLIETIYQCLKQGVYIFTFIDYGQIFHYDPLVHNILLIGANLDAKVLYALGYQLNNGPGHFQIFQIPFSQFVDAYYSEVGENSNQSFVMITFRQPGAVFSWEALKTQLTDYGGSRLSYDRMKDYYDESDTAYFTFLVNSQRQNPYVYGLQCYESMNYYLKFHREIGNAYLDQRIFRVFMEHKTLMVRRFRYLAERRAFAIDWNPALEAYEDVERRATILFNLILKLQWEPQRGYSKGMDTLKVLEEKERNIFSRIMDRV